MAFAAACDDPAGAPVAAVVVAGLAGLLYWQTSSHHEEELDAGLLAGELPIHAYTDPGFDAWLRHTSHTPQQ
jgi:hypothetical protein